MINITKPINRDFLDIASLDRQAWKDNKDSQYIPDGEHTWKMWQEHAVIYKAVYGTKLIGAILAFKCEDNSYCLHKIFTNKEYRRQGIATNLLKVLLANLDKKQQDIFLTVDPNNKTAINLYAKFGFTNRQFIKGYYRNEEDRYILTKKAKTNI